MSALAVGARVRYSGYALQSVRDYWQGCGAYPAKDRARAEYERQLALRGTVAAVLPRGYEVRWDDGSMSQSISYRIEVDA